MQNPENLATHIRLVDLANIIINEESNTELLENINNLLDKYSIGKSLNKISEDLDLAFQSGQMFEPKTLEYLREKNKNQQTETEEIDSELVEEAQEKETKKPKKESKVEN
jgi:hypothetical protein